MKVPILAGGNFDPMNKREDSRPINRCGMTVKGADSAKAGSRRGIYRPQGRFSAEVGETPRAPA
jgi:hypothetical protein